MCQFSNRRRQLLMKFLQSKKITSHKTRQQTSFPKAQILLTTSRLSRSLNFYRMPRTRAKKSPILMRMESWFSHNIYLKRYRCNCNKYSRKEWCNNSSKSSSYSNSNKWQMPKVLGNLRCLVCPTESNRTKTSATSWQSQCLRPRNDTLTSPLEPTPRVAKRDKATLTLLTKGTCSLRLAGLMLLQ
jgi:hypothetical protein